MIREWYTANELAGTTGVAATESGNARKAKRENWKSRPRKAKGGGSEYHISTLPAATQSALRAKDIDTTPDLDQSITELFSTDETATKKAEFEKKKTRQAAMKQFTALPESKKVRARAKEWLILELRSYIEQHGLKRICAFEQFCVDFKDNKITVPDRYKPHLSRLHGRVNLHPSTLRDWDKQHREQGLHALVDNYGSRKGKSKIEQNAELKRVVLGCLSQQPHITGKKIKQYLEAAEPHLNIVSAKSIDRYLETWKKENQDAWLYATNPDKWKNVMMPAFGSHHEEIERLNQLWELDSTPGDWMLTNGRHSVIGVIDMYSRRFKLLVSKTSKASAVCQVFRKAIIDWGVPEIARTDNGADYVSEQFTTVAAGLEVEIDLCNPFASEEKGTIERAFKTMSHGILDLLPGFIGHNVADRKVIEARKSFAQRIMTPGEVVEVALSSEELQEKLDQWSEHVYMHDAHSGLDGKTPWEVANNWIEPRNIITDERALDMLLSEIAGIRTVTKKGIQVDRHHYISREIKVGSQIQLRRDESDIGRLYAYGLDGEYLGQVICHKILGISSAEAATAAKAAAKKLAAEHSKEFKANRKHVKGNIAEVVIKHRIEQSQNITALPHKSQEYTTPGLQAARMAADSKLDRQPESAGLSDKEKADQQSLVEQMNQPAEIIEIHDSAEQRYGRAWTLERRDILSEDDRQWLASYQKSAEYDTQKVIHEDFSLTPEWSEA